MSENTNEAKHYAPNIKSAWLQEVEDDAVYITNKRFAEQREAAEREKEKLARDEAKSNTSVETDKKGK